MAAACSGVGYQRLPTRPSTPRISASARSRGPARFRWQAARSSLLTTNRCRSQSGCWSPDPFGTVTSLVRSAPRSVGCPLVRRRTSLPPAHSRRPAAPAPSAGAPGRPRPVPGSGPGAPGSPPRPSAGPGGWASTAAYLRSPTQQHDVLAARVLPQGLHGRDHRRHVGRGAVVGLVPDRHRASSGRDVQGADLLLLAAAVAVSDLGLISRRPAPLPGRPLSPAPRSGPQRSALVSSPKALIACTVSAPRSASCTAATSSRQRPSRASFSSAGRIPNGSPTAHASAQSTLSSSGRGAVKRLATSAVTTSPVVSCATSRTGARASTHSLSCRRSRYARITGNAPRRLIDQHLAHGHGGSSCASTMPGGRASRPGFSPRPVIQARLRRYRLAMCEMQA